MNLIKKTNTYYLLFLLLIFPVMLVVDYYFIRHLVNNEVEEILLHERQRIEFHIEREGALPSSTYLLKSRKVTPDRAAFETFGDTTIYEAYANKPIPYKTYTFKTDVGQHPQQITLKHVLLEIHELIWLLFLTTSFIIILLGLGLYLINKKIYKWAWNPFFTNISRLKEYNIINKEPIQLETSNINEFEELNTVIARLMDQVKKDFQNLKEFNENISHEIQTPLAIIRNKVVLLLESKSLNEKELQRVDAIYRETNKLSKIGKALTLISRIENQEFRRFDVVDVKTMVGNILSNMQEIIDFKKLKVTTALHPVTVECDHILADILLTNLIKNAVQHNVEDGSIKIELRDGLFKIGNTGEIPEVTVEKLFGRFQRGKAKADSLGLGLAINQKICEIYGFTLIYEQDGEMHLFSLSFEQNPDKKIIN